MQIFIDLLGFTAAAATILAYSQTDVRRMRLWAIAANCFFIAYGGVGSLMPPLLLHVILLPLNLRMLLLLNHSRRGLEANGS